MFLLLRKIAGNLNGRPLFFFKESDSFVLHSIINAVIARFPAFVVHNVTLSRFPIIMPIMTTVALYFA